MKVVFLAQVMNLEDELVRCTDVKKVTELTKSASIMNFKTDFCRMKSKDCRLMLERHKISCECLWASSPPDAFAFIEKNSRYVKI